MFCIFHKGEDRCLPHIGQLQKHLLHDGYKYCVLLNDGTLVTILWHGNEPKCEQEALTWD